MGSSQSRNAVKAASQAISNLMASTVQNANLKSGQSQVIQIDHSASPITISGNQWNQQVLLDLQQLAKSTITQEGKQDLEQELQQTAKSLVSGLTFGSSGASNALAAYLDAVMTISSSIGQSCAAASGQIQAIVITDSTGAITITDNVMNQITSLTSKCTQTALENNSAVQALQQQISQSASATNKGLDLGLLLLILAALILLPILLPLTTILSTVLKLFFILLIVAGIISIVWYFFYSQHMALTNFAIPPCGSQVGAISTEYKDAASAAAACLANKSLAGFYFKALAIDPSTGTYIPISPPQTTFYDKITCAVELDQGKLWQNDKANVPQIVNVAGVKQKEPLFLWGGIGGLVIGLAGALVGQKSS